MNDKRLLNVLFVGRGNSARSIFAECILNREGRGAFRGYSAGSHPAGEISPYALAELERQNYLTGDLTSKDWSAFAAPEAPRLDFVFTLCEEAASVPAPTWPGDPLVAQWSIADPAAVSGSDLDRKRAFVRAFSEVESRVSIFVNLPFDALDRLKLQDRLDAIGERGHVPA